MSGVPASLPGSDFPPVVVADDDRDVRTMLRTLLELDGHEVVEAKDGDEALRLWLREPAVSGGGRHPDAWPGRPAAVPEDPGQQVLGRYQGHRLYGRDGDPRGSK